MRVGTGSLSIKEKEEDKGLEKPGIGQMRYVIHALEEKGWNGLSTIVQITIPTKM